MLYNNIFFMEAGERGIYFIAHTAKFSQHLRFAPGSFGGVFKANMQALLYVAGKHGAGFFSITAHSNNGIKRIIKKLRGVLGAMAGNIYSYFRHNCNR